MLHFYLTELDTGKTVSENPLAAVVVAQLLPVTNGAEPGAGTTAAEDLGGAGPGTATTVGRDQEPVRGEFSALLTDLELPESNGILPATSLPASMPILPAPGVPSPLTDNTDGNKLPEDGELIPGSGHPLPLTENPLNLPGLQTVQELLREGTADRPSVPLETRSPQLPASTVPTVEDADLRLVIGPTQTGVSPSGFTAESIPVTTPTSPTVGPEPMVVAGAGARLLSGSPSPSSGDALPTLDGIEVRSPTGSADVPADGMSDGEAGEQPLPQPRAERNAVVGAQTNAFGIRLDHMEPPAALLNQADGIRPGGAATPDEAITLNLRGEKAVWLEPLAQRLAVMAGKGANTAELQLSPPHLGRLEIRIAVHSDQASVWLSSANPEVRDVLQQSMPRLEGMLEELGINLADSEVMEESLQQFSAESGSDFEESSEPGSETAPELNPSGAQSLTILDTWA